jgi:hypothetical protein
VTATMAAAVTATMAAAVTATMAATVSATTMAATTGHCVRRHRERCRHRCDKSEIS